MARLFGLWPLWCAAGMLLALSPVPLSSADADTPTPDTPMSKEERRQLRDEAKGMFYHAYDAYMKNAFPADELMPLSCRGRFRGVEPNRGDIDDALGNYSVTLIDSLDTLVVMGDLDGFEEGVKLVIDHVTFDHDLIVSVFETNIRVVGGLVSAHILAEYVRDRVHPGGRTYFSWYQGELLNLALDIGTRLLPAFNSTTGLPHPRVNLRHGIKPGKIRPVGETCTACAGTMILEFAALSRLSGEPVFEEKASHAMDVLWASRHRMSNLVGNVLNIDTGDWVRRDSGVGAGIDSYYEYVAKAYVLLGEEKYWTRWQTHYAAITKYMGHNPLIQDVHMHRPRTHSKHFIDALAAFWPGLLVLMGDMKPAIENHEVLYQVMQRHNFIPEAFTTDFQVHWGSYFLRPEFLESTYFLFRATEDPHYLEVGKTVLQGLQKHAKVPCGYATIKDVRTLQQEDRMDSFVLAETFKYLYLLFAEDDDLVVDINDFVFTTEGHLLPLHLARLSNRTAVPLKPGSPASHSDDLLDADVESSRSCPSTDFLFPSSSSSTSSSSSSSSSSSTSSTSSSAVYAEGIRSTLANHVNDKCPGRKVIQRKLTAQEFQSGNADHLDLIKSMGIQIVSLSDGRVQLLHTFANAATPEDGEEGLLFMQEMIEMSKHSQQLPDTEPKILSYQKTVKTTTTPAKDGPTQPGARDTVTTTATVTTQYLYAGPAQFGKLIENGFKVTSQVFLSDPVTACGQVQNGEKFWGKIVVVERGDCMFVEKARQLESLGAKGGIVMDNVPGTSARDNPMFAMSGDGTDDVSIPMIFLFHADSKTLLKAIEEDPLLEVTVQEGSEDSNSGGGGGVRGDDDEDEDETPYDFTAPVKSFLERSRRRVESYFNSSPSPSQNEDGDSAGSSTNEEEESLSDVIELHEKDGRFLATRTQTIQRPDGTLEDVKTVEALRHEGKGTVTVQTLTDDEVEALLRAQDDEIDIILPSVLQTPPDGGADADPPVVDPARPSGVLRLLDPSNALVADILAQHGRGKAAADPAPFLAAETPDLVNLFVQSLWEDRSLSPEQALEQVANLLDELGSGHAAANKVDEHIARFTRQAREAAASLADDVDVGQEFAAVAAEASTGDVVRHFLNRMSVVVVDKHDEMSSDLAKQYLAVHPVLGHVMDGLKGRLVAQRKAVKGKHKEEL